MPPKLSRAKIASSSRIVAVDEAGSARDIDVTGEYPLTIYVNKQEVITLMTLGQQPESLALGWLYNQHLIESAQQVASVIADWEINAVSVTTHQDIAIDLDARRTVTSGCGQGTLFGDALGHIENLRLQRDCYLTDGALIDLLRQVRERDTVYKQSGAVHACLLASFDASHAVIHQFVEDVGRHNAIDTIAGNLLLQPSHEKNTLLYTTGRLTSEMVIKCALMGIPYLVSRSGLTMMGYEIGKSVDLTMIGRAINTRYLIYSGADFFVRAGGGTTDASA